MNKLDYLKKALQASCGSRLAWIISAFCMTRESPEAYQENPYPFRLISAHAKYQYVTDKGQLETIDDSDTMQPLFAFKDKVVADPSWAPNIKAEVTCTVGNLLFNSIVILTTFGPKFPFQAGKLSVQMLEQYIAPLLTDTPEDDVVRDQGRLYVDEYLVFRDALVYMEMLAPITSWSTTRKNISRPVGIDEFKANLILEYGGRTGGLKDPTNFAEFETRLKAFDKEYLKDDPAFGTFLKGKVLDISRKKMFLTIGIPDRLDPKDPAVPIIGTLEEGQPTDPVELTASLNGARFGSYSRGTETINGGVVSKSVIRVGSNFVIDMDDCGTELGLKKTYTSDNFNTMVGRIVKTEAGWLAVENPAQAQNYVDKVVIVRSPAYCKAGPGDRLCRACAGPALSQYKEGLIIPLTEVSQLILTQSLKAMHGKVLSTAMVDIVRATS
jgi:hypothetical protein